MTPSPTASRPLRAHSRGVRVGAGPLVLAGILLVLALSAPAGAADDGTPPTLRDGERDNATTIRLTVADDADVDEASVAADDFALSDGSVEGIRVNESGSDATVRLFLDGRLNTDEVTVGLAEGAVIADAAGNELTNGSVSVTGMDSYVPQLRRYAVERVDGTTGRILVRTNEPLERFRVDVDGPADATLNETDFREVDDGSYDSTYAATYRFPADGAYRVRLVSVTDRGGLDVNFRKDATFLRDLAPPTAVLDGPAHLAAGDRGRFDGSASTDDVGIASIVWRVDGNRTRATAANDTGNATAIERAFAEPGRHAVSLTVVDGRGNRSTANHTVTVHEATPRAGVSVERANESHVRARVGDNRTVERVRVADAFGRLATASNVSLRSLTVSASANESRALNVTATPGAPAFENATAASALAAFAIDHGDRPLDDPTFRFAVSSARRSRAGVSYADVGLYRDDGNWTALDTRIVRATSSSVVYEATAPGLSTFVVGAETASAARSEGGDGSASAASADAEADVRVTAASLADGTFASGEYVVVDATLANEGNATGTTVVGMTVGGETAATRAVTVPAGEVREVQFGTQATRGGTVAVDGTVAGELSLATATPTAAGGGESPADEGSERREAATPSATPGTASPGADAGGLPLPNPLALWPGGLAGAVLTWVVGVVGSTYAVLKALAIYLGY